MVIEERRGLGPKGERLAWGQEKEKRPLTLCLNSDFSSRVMVSALAMTGMMFTTLLRCFMNSRSRGRKLGPREGGVSEPPGPPHSASATTPGAPLGQEDWAGNWLGSHHLPSAEQNPTLYPHVVHQLHFSLPWLWGISWLL